MRGRLLMGFGATVEQKAARNGDEMILEVKADNSGLLIGRKDFFWSEGAETADEELVRSAVEQFYNKEVLPPKEVLIPVSLEPRKYR